MKKLLVVGFLLLALLSMSVIGFTFPSNANNALADNGKNNIPQRMSRGGHGAMVPLEVLSDLSGLTLTEIREMRFDGMSIAEIARNQDIEIETLVDEVYEKRSETMQDMVDNGIISEEWAEVCLDNMKNRITGMLEGTGECPQGGYMQSSKNMGNMHGGMSGKMRGNGFDGGMRRGMMVN